MPTKLKEDRSQDQLVLFLGGSVTFRMWDFLIGFQHVVAGDLD